MRRAVSPTKAGAIHREHDRQVLDRDVVDDLVVGALQERRVDRADRLHAARRQPRHRTDRMRLGDPDVEVAMRETLGELREARAVGHRRRDPDDARVALGGGDQRVGKRLRERWPRRFLLDFPSSG